MKREFMIRFVKIFAVIVFIFGLIFYLGYGSILPFTNPEYSLLDNIWLIVFPLVFIGLIVGLKWGEDWRIFSYNSDCSLFFSWVLFLETKSTWTNVRAFVNWISVYFSRIF
jgi:hypothetical protein